MDRHLRRWLKDHARTHRKIETTCNVFGSVWAIFWWTATLYIANITYFTSGAIANGDHIIVLVFALIAITETISIFKKGKLKKKAEHWEKVARRTNS